MSEFCPNIGYHNWRAAEFIAHFFLIVTLRPSLIDNDLHYLLGVDLDYTSQRPLVVLEQGALLFFCQM